MSDKPRQFFITDEDKRIVAGWASVEIKDLQGEIVPVEAMKRAMFDYVSKRGGVLMYEHSNMAIGKILQWEVKTDPDTGKPGVWIVAQLNRGSLEDQVWEAIKAGKITGFSIGGLKGKEKTAKIKTEDGKEEVVKVIEDLELYEISLTATPANPEARIEEVNYFAKSVEPVKKACKDRYMADEHHFKEMTCPDKPDVKNKMCGCVRYMMNCQGKDLDSAYNICAYIYHQKYGKNLDALIEMALALEDRINKTFLDTQALFGKDLYRVDVRHPVKENEGYDRDFTTVVFNGVEDASIAKELVDCVSSKVGVSSYEIYTRDNMTVAQIHFTNIPEGIKAVDDCITAYENISYIRAVGAITSYMVPEYMNPTFSGKEAFGKPFAGFKDWDDCMRHMKEQYRDKYSGEKLEDVASRVCGKLYWEYEGKKKAEKAEDESECRKRYTWRDSEGNEHFESIRCDLIEQLVEEQPSLRGKEMPFCGCVREKMECEGYSYEDARNLCAWIFFSKSGSGSENINSEKVTKEGGATQVPEAEVKPEEKKPEAQPEAKPKPKEQAGVKELADKIDKLVEITSKLVTEVSKLVSEASRGATSASDVKEEKSVRVKANKVILSRKSRRPRVIKVIKRVDKKETAKNENGDDRLSKLEKVVAVLAKRVANIEAMLKASEAKSEEKPKEPVIKAETPRPVNAEATVVETDEIGELLRKAGQGDMEAVQKLKEILKSKVMPQM